MNGALVSIGDVARVRDGFAEQTNIVRVDGRRAAYLTILKKADASTLAVVEAARAMIPQIKAVAPKGLDVRMDFDQSKFVRAAISGVVREGLISAALVAVMILAFLGSWRSVLIACISIPLAMAAAVIGLNLTGNSFNIMTLGGLSLSIGLLVDNAIVTIENVHRNRAMGKPLTVAILDALEQIATPAIVATLAICVVFFPVVLLQGPARFLFIPIALAVVIAMLASYVLSRSLVPTLSRMLLVHEPLHDPEGIDTGGAVAVRPHHDPNANFVVRLALKFNDTRDWYFARFQAAYGRFLETLIARRWFTIGAFAALVLVSLALVPVIGQDFFPVDRRRDHEAALPRAVGDAHRAYRGARRAGGGAHPADRPAERTRHDQLDDRHPGIAQPRVRADGQLERHGRGNPRRAQSRPQADAPVHEPAAVGARHRVPRLDRVFPDGRHRRAGAQLRPLGADRRADPVPESRQRVRRWPARCATGFAPCRARSTSPSSRCSTIRCCSST